MPPGWFRRPFWVLWLYFSVSPEFFLFFSNICRANGVGFDFNAHVGVNEGLNFDHGGGRWVIGKTIGVCPAVGSQHTFD